MPTNNRVTGARTVLKSLDLGETQKGQDLIRLVVSYAGWFLLLFVGAVYVLSLELRQNEFGMLLWLSAYFLYLVSLELISRTKANLYETTAFRMARIQIMLFFGSVLLYLTGGAESYFWFFYLWPLFATAFYFSWIVTWVVYGEAVVFAFLTSLLRAEVLTSSNIAQLLSNLAILLLLAAVLRVLVESVRRYQVMERKLRYSDVLQQIQQDVDTAVDLQEVLDRILQRAVELVGARDGTLMLLDENNELHFLTRYGASLPEDKAERTFKLGEGVAGWVAENGKPYICRNTNKDTLFAAVISGYPILSLVTVPIISHGRVLGVINVDSDKLNRFSAVDA